MKAEPHTCRRLVVVHFHLRPGGVRRVIELALPALAAARRNELREIVLAVGESNDGDWFEQLRQKVRPTAVALHVEPAFGYVSEQAGTPDKIRECVLAALEVLKIEKPDTVVWAHNLGLGRNLFLADELARSAANLISHHHDFWFDHRWERWPEIEACGWPTPGAVARTIFGRGIHAGINGADMKLLQKSLPDQNVWLPNPMVRPPLLKRQRVAAAKRWLSGILGDDGPVWICPGRFLRRKNFAEAILLTRWLRPDAWLVTTADVSSVAERANAHRLMTSAENAGWRVRFSVLANHDGPPVEDLIAASEVVLMTSVREGFGLPYLEATAAGKPLIARRLENVVPDLERAGFHFPHLYDQVSIAPALFGFAAEKNRQHEAWCRNRDLLPAGLRRWAKPVDWNSAPIAIHQLTLEAQLEVLAVSPAESWRICRPFNPRLAAWRGRWSAAEWPDRAERDFGATAYAARFWDAVDTMPMTAIPRRQAEAVQREFIRERLGKP